MNHRAATAPPNTIPAYVVLCGVLRVLQASEPLQREASVHLQHVYATLGYRWMFPNCGAARVLLHNTGTYHISTTGQTVTPNGFAQYAKHGETRWNSTYHLAYAAYCANTDSYTIGND